MNPRRQEALLPERNTPPNGPDWCVCLTFTCQPSISKAARATTSPGCDWRRGLSVYDADRFCSWSVATVWPMAVWLRRKGLKMSLCLMDIIVFGLIYFSRIELMWVSLLFSGAQLQNSKMSVCLNEMSWQSSSACIFFAWLSNELPVEQLILSGIIP